MSSRLLGAAAICAIAAMTMFGCRGKPPKQVEAPDALSDKGSDMQTGQEGNGGDVKTKAGEKSGEEQMHEKCCGQCKVGLGKDRSGGKPEAIPCTDFTDTLDVFCLEYFRGKKMMASQCN